MTVAAVEESDNSARLSVALAAESARLAPVVEAHLTRTPLARFAALSEELRADVLVKCEHQQRTGSFKARGALAKALTLTAEQRERGVVTASSGNHGLGVANAMAVLGGRTIVFVPADASTVKVAAIRRLGAEIRAAGSDVGDLEVAARGYADEHGLTYVSPYNDLDVIAGQGTIGVELAQQAGEHGLDAVYVAVGGGGLISGVASVLRQRLPGVRVVGASPANDAAMVAAVRAGHAVRVESRPTLSDGTAGSVEEGAVTIGLCASLVDEWVLVTEEDIRAALRTVIDTEHQLIEGAAAVAFAAACARRDSVAGQRIAVISCGGNIAAATLAAALAN